MSLEVGLAQGAEHTRSQEGGGDVSGWLLHQGSKHIDHPAGMEL